MMLTEDNSEDILPPLTVEPAAAPAHLHRFLYHRCERGREFPYTLPLFADIDGDGLMFKATHKDGSALPGWLMPRSHTR